jgi:two-component system, sporulation sensor kinase E
MDPDLKDHLVTESLEGIVVTDLTGSILECNQTAGQLLGYTHIDLKNEHVGILFPPASTSHLLPNLMCLAVNEGGFRGEIMLQKADDEAVMVQLHANGFPTTSPRYVLFRFLDWRETREIIRQLKESNQLAVLGSLTRSMAHEIINPLSVIGAYTRKLLDSSPCTKEEVEWIRHVNTSIERLEAMIESVQTYLNLPHASFTLASPGKILDEAVKAYFAHTQDQGILIQMKTHEKLPDIYLDPVLFEMAINAAFRNAIQRMPRGGNLMVTTSARESDICIAIEDSGPFLDGSQLEEDLSPIHVVGSDKSHLNLAIARRIIDEHSGSFHLGPSELGGIKVKFTLPRDRRAIVRHRIL